MLFLDDSGKPDVNHASRAVVIAGFSIPSTDVSTLSRRVLGAKAKHLPARGHPASWEVKAADFIKPNPWNRRKNRDFAGELVRIVSTLGGTIYSVTIDKTKMIHPMTLAQTTPLMPQTLIEHFEAECRHHGETGVLVADWSSHYADQHASRAWPASLPNSIFIRRFTTPAPTRPRRSRSPISSPAPAVGSPRVTRVWRRSLSNSTGSSHFRLPPM